MIPNCHCLSAWILSCLVISVISVQVVVIVIVIVVVIVIIAILKFVVIVVIVHVIVIMVVVVVAVTLVCTMRWRTYGCCWVAVLKGCQGVDELGSRGFRVARDKFEWNLPSVYT